MFPLQNVSTMTAEGPSSSRLAQSPPFRPGPERPGRGASLAMPRRRPERSTNPGGPLACASRPGPWPGLREIRLGEARAARSLLRRLRSRPPGRPSPGPPPAWHQLGARAPGPRRLHPPTPSRRPVSCCPVRTSRRLRQLATPRQCRPVTLCSMRPSHWPGGERERRGERAAPWNAGSRGPAPPLHAGK